MALELLIYALAAFNLSMLNYLVVASTTDCAGMSIAHALIEDWSFKQVGDSFDGSSMYRFGSISLVFTRREVIFADHLGERFDPDVFIFISKHRSETGKPCLTAHFPGNFSTSTQYGGRPRELAYTYPSLHKTYLSAVWEQRMCTPQYQVVTEPMHHGPTGLGRPVLFVEIGSTDVQWRDQKAAEQVASALMSTLRKGPSKEKVGVAFGGVHYSDKITQMIVHGGYAFGAIATKHALPYVDENLFNQMVQKSVEPVKYALLDWKGLAGEKEKILKILEGMDLEVLRI